MTLRMELNVSYLSESKHSNKGTYLFVCHYLLPLFLPFSVANNIFQIGCDSNIVFRVMSAKRHHLKTFRLLTTYSQKYLQGVLKVLRIGLLSV